MKFLVLTALALSSLTAAATAAETLRVATEGAFAPWNYVGEDGQLAGYDVDLANAICAHAKMTCQITTNAWDSIIPNLLAGNYDLIMAGMSVTPERSRTVLFAQEYAPPNPSVFLALAGKELGFEPLAGAKIGVQGGSIQEAYAQAELAEGNTIMTFIDPNQAMADLVADNLDIILADRNFLKPIVEGSGGALAIIGPEMSVTGGVAPAMRPDDAELLAIVDKALTDLKADGTVDELIAKWFDGAGPVYAE